jgi:hypothetical protein
LNFPLTIALCCAIAKGETVTITGTASFYNVKTEGAVGLISAVLHPFDFAKSGRGNLEHTFLKIFTID